MKFSSWSVCHAALLLWMLLPLIHADAQEKVHSVEDPRTMVVSPGVKTDTVLIREMIVYAGKLRSEDPDSALILLLHSLEQCREAAFPEGTISALIDLGHVYQDKGMYDKSLSMYSAALRQSLINPTSTRNLSAIYNSTGNCYNIQGQYPQAAAAYYHAIKLSADYPAVLANSYNGLGTVLLYMGKPLRALVYLERAEEVARKDGDVHTLGATLANKGVYYARRNEFDSAVFYSRKALELGRSHRIFNLMHNALMNLGDISMLQNRPSSALPFLLEAERLSASKPVMSFNRNSAAVAIGKLYFQLGDNRKAESYLRDALHHAKSLQPSELPLIHSLLADVYAGEGRYREAFEHKSEYASLTDSFTGQEIAANVNQLEVRYRTSEKDRQIISNQLLFARQENQLRTKNTWLVIITTGAVLFAVLLLGLYRNNRNRQAVQAKQIRIMQQEKEIDLLKAMMAGEEKERGRLARELHDGIGGMLAAIKMNVGTVQKKYEQFPHMQELDHIMHLVEDTAGEVRKTAHNLMPDVLARHGLEEAVRMYCDNVSMAEHLQAELQWDADTAHLPPSLQLSLYRMVQELMQNIIKHARATQAVVEIILRQSLLTVTVEDNGAGFDVKNITWGLGLRNIRSQVEVMKGYFSVESAAGIGTTVSVRFDLRDNGM